MANLDGKRIALASCLSDVDDARTYRACRDKVGRLVAR